MKITEKDLYYLLVNEEPELTDFILIEDEIESSDPEDGGADHRCVIQHKETKKYYELTYCDWDVDYNFEFDEDTEECDRCDISLDLIEVYPKEVTQIIYTSNP